MKKKTYTEPLTEVVKLEVNYLMETWSIGVDNDPNHGIGDGQEDDIGAKQGFFDEEDDWAKLGFNAWEY